MTRPRDEPIMHWVVCWSPADYPNKFTVRRHEITAGEIKATDEGYVSSNIEWIHELMLRKGLFRMPRQPEDDPVIVEVWM